MRRRHLGADARLALGHDGEGEADHVDAALQHLCRHLLRQRGVAEHDRDDRVAGAGEREAGLGHLCAEARGIGVEPLAQRVAVLDQVEDLQRGAGDGRRQRVGEEIGPRALAQPVDHFAPARGVAARGAAERLAERAGDDVDPALDAAMLGRAAAVLADEADRVAVVDHDHGVVLLGQVADALQIGDDAVHREDAVGGDQPEARVCGLLQLRLEVGHVVVGVAVAPRLGEPHAVDDRGVVQRVGDDRVLLRQQRLEQPAIGVEAGGVEDRVLHAEERRDLRLELPCAPPACRR